MSNRRRRQYSRFQRSGIGLIEIGKYCQVTCAGPHYVMVSSASVKATFGLMCRRKYENYSCCEYRTGGSER